MERLKDLDEGNLRDILINADVLGLSNAARERAEWLLFAAESGKGMSEVSEHFEICRMTLRRWLKRFDPKNPASLEEESRCPKSVRESDIEDSTVELIVEYRRASPRMGADVISKKLREHGVKLSPSAIWKIIKDNQLFFADTISHRKKRNNGDSGAGGPKTTPIILLLIATAAAAALFAPRPALAAGTSASFWIDFDSLITQTRQSAGDSFTIIGGTTNIQKAGAGSSFEITPYSYLPAEDADSASDTDSTEGAAVARGGHRGSSASMAEKIRTAYNEYLKKIGRPEEEHDSHDVLQPDLLDTPIIRSYRERLLATVDGRRVIYRDVPSDAWYAPYVAKAVADGIAHGYETVGGFLTGEFGAANPTTKAEALKMALIVSNVDVPDENVEVLNRSVRGTWAEKYIGKAEEMTLSGYPRSANVHEPETRAAVLRTIFEIVGIPVAKRPADYTDVPADHPDSRIIATASFYGIVSGFADGTFRPNEIMTRAAASKVMTLAKQLLLP